MGSPGHDPEIVARGRDHESQALSFCYEDEDCASALRFMKERNLT
jgi:hypothetical protein